MPVNESKSIEPVAVAVETDSAVPVIATTSKKAARIKAPAKAKAVKVVVAESVEPAKEDKVERSPVKPEKLAKAERHPKAQKVEKPAKPAKVKLVRDSFAMPEADYANLALLKQRALDAGFEVKKSELLRLGVKLLATLAPEELVARAQSLEKLKTGRPVKS